MAATKLRQPVSLRRVSTLEALTAALREQILDGTLAAGTALREADLCQVFGVSRHTVRTALQALTHEGLARHEPNRGVSIPKLTAVDVTDLFALRLTLEQTAVRHLVEEAELREPVRVAVGDLLSLREDAPWGEVRDADLAFHQALVDALHSPRISRTYQSLMSELRLSFLQLQHELEHPSTVAEEHAAILRAIDSDDADAAASLLGEHLHMARQDIAAAYQRRDAAEA